MGARGAEVPADRVKRLRAFRASFDSDRDFVYGIFDPAERELLGAAGSHTRRGEGIREIGYWVRADRVRNGLATEAATALAKVAFEIDGASRVEIRCDVGNGASSGIPKKLGFRLEGVLRQQTQFLRSRRDSEVWSLVSSEYATSAVRRARIKAFDAIGGVLIS